MRNIAILLCTFCIAFYARVQADDAVPPTCMERMGLTLADLPGLIHDNTEEGIRKRGCLEACVMQKIGLMNGNVIDMQKIDEQIDQVLSDSPNKDDIRQSVHQCAEQAANDDECLVAQAFAKCGLEHLKLRLQHLLNQPA